MQGSFLLCPKGLERSGKGNYFNIQTKSQTMQGCQINKNYFLVLKVHTYYYNFI